MTSDPDTQTPGDRIVWRSEAAGRLIPWRVVIVNQMTGEERRESYRALWRATRRVRQINNERRVKVRWAWS